MYRTVRATRIKATTQKLRTISLLRLNQNTASKQQKSKVKTMTEQNTLSIAELQQQANAGDAQAQFYLADCYIKGAGVEKEKELALMWLKKAAEQGNRAAQCNLILLYPNELIEEDLELALEYLALVEDSINSQEFQEVHDPNYLKDERKKISTIFWIISRRFYLYAEKQDLSKCLDFLIKSFEYSPKDVNDEFYLMVTASICELMEASSLPSNQQKAIIDRLARLAGEQNPDDFMNCMVNAFFGNKSGVNDEITFKHGDKYAGFLFAAKFMYSLPSQIQQWEKGDFVQNPITSGMVPRYLKKIPPTAQYAKENVVDILAVLMADKEFDAAEKYIEAVFKNNIETSTADISKKDHEPAKNEDFKAIWKDFQDKEHLKRLLLTINKQTKELDKESKEKEALHKALHEKEKEMLSFFTHTMRNALATAPESLRQAIHLLGGEVYEKDTKHYQAINKIAALFSTLSLTDCLIDTFKQSISDPQEFRQSWQNDHTGEATPKWVIASALRQALNRIIFMSDTTELRKLLNNPETALIKATRKSFIEEVLPLNVDSHGVEVFYSWTLAHIPAVEVSIAASDTLKFGVNQTRFSLLFAITSELILNALKYWDGENHIQIAWQLTEQGGYVFSVKNHCQANASSNLAGTHKGLAFINRLVELLGEQAQFVCKSEGQFFTAELILTKALFDGES